MNTDQFLAKLVDYGLPPPKIEHKFSKTRGWRFDYCWPEKMVALEVEGAVWARGRHTRGAGFLQDVEKYNAAIIAGWKLIRTTPSALGTSENISDLISLLHA